MDAAIRRAALRSTAKVAFGAGFCLAAAMPACGGATTALSGGDEPPGDAGSSVAGQGGGTGGGAAAGGGGGTDPPNAAGAAGRPADAASDTPATDALVQSNMDLDGGEELQCVRPVGAFDSGMVERDANALACCLDYVAAAASDGGLAGSDAGTLAGDPSLVNCCRYISHAYDPSLPPVGGWPATAYTVCCYRGILTFEEQLTAFCSPWGPPVPPPLDTLLEVAA